MSTSGWSASPRTSEEVATGFFVSDAGYLITAHHDRGPDRYKGSHVAQTGLRARTTGADDNQTSRPEGGRDHPVRLPVALQRVSRYGRDHDGVPQVSVLGITTKVTCG